MDWLRLWHEMPNDPKLKTIARKSGQRIGDVIAVFVHLLVIASSNKDRGALGNFDPEDLASALNMDVEEIDSILKTMEGRVIGNGRLTGWEGRQPAIEDGAESARGKPGDNYIYFVAATDSDVVKIGVSKNPWARLSDLQGGSSSKYSVLATIKTPNRSEFEIHKFFAETRKSGEWFGRSKALNLLIEKIKAKSLVQYEECITFLKSLDSVDYSLLRSYVAATKEEIREDEIRLEEKNTNTAPPPVDNSVPVGTSVDPVFVFLENQGIQNLNPNDPEFTRLKSGGADLGYWEHAASVAVGTQNLGFAYVLGIVRNQLAKSKQGSSTVPARKGPDPALAKLDADKAVTKPPSESMRLELAALKAKTWQERQQKALNQGSAHAAQ